MLLMMICENGMVSAAWFQENESVKAKSFRAEQAAEYTVHRTNEGSLPLRPQVIHILFHLGDLMDRRKFVNFNPLAVDTTITRSLLLISP